MVVSDNGSGIAFDELGRKFKPFSQSDKAIMDKAKLSAIHGKNGVGRFTFFTFATMAKWETVYSRHGENYSYTISIAADALNKYKPSDEIATDAPCGTVVRFYNIDSASLSADKLKEAIAAEFCWFLELHKKDNFTIELNGDSVRYQFLMNLEKSYTLNMGDIDVALRIICWNRKLSEYSKYYYIKSDGSECCLTISHLLTHMAKLKPGCLLLVKAAKKLRLLC